MLTSYTNKYIGNFNSFPSKQLESMQPLDVLYIATYMNKLKKNNLEDVLKAPHYTTTIKKWKSLLGNTPIDIENHENVEEISKKLKLNIQLFYPRTNAIIGGSNHHKQSYRRAQLLKVKKNVYKPIIYGGDKGFSTFGLFQSNEKFKDESISIDLNDETYDVNDWNALLKEPLPNDAFIVYQKNQANLQKDIKDQCTAIVETDTVKKLTNVPIDGIDYAPIGFTTINDQQNEHKYTGQYAYYINTNGQKVCFNVSVIDKLPKTSSVFKCPYTKNDLITFKDILLRFRRQLQGTKLLSKVDDYLKNSYNFDPALLPIDLEKWNDNYLVYNLDDVERNFEQLKKVEGLKLMLENQITEDTEDWEDIDWGLVLSKIFQLNNIVELRADAVFLESLPPGIGNLSSLKKLDLSGTSLSELPDEIGQLQSLQILNLHENKLTRLPDTIGDLQNIKELYISENPLRELPESLKNIVTSDNLLVLSVRYLSELKKQKIPETLKDAFIKLMQEKPDVLRSDNRFKDLVMSTIDLDIGDFDRYVVHNLDDVNRNFEQLKKVEKLKLTLKYEITDTEDTDTEDTEDDWGRVLSKLFQLNNIIELNAEEIGLRFLPPGIGKLQSLEHLDLQGNELKTIPSEIGQLENLKNLNLEKNRITTKLPDEIGNLQNLRTLKLNDQQRYFQYPQNVDLLPDTIGKLSTLYYLHINDAYITRLPDTIGNLQRIIELDISENPLRELPESLKNIMTYNLRSINVKYLDQLEDIPEKLKDAFIKLMQEKPDVLESDNEFNERLMEM